MLYLAEYTDIGSTGRGSIAIPLEPALKTQVFEVTAGSVQSETFAPGTCVITLLSDEDCMFKIGADPNAMDGGNKLIAKTEKVIAVQVGAGLRIAVTAANVRSVSKMDNMDSLEALVKLLASPADAKTQYDLMAANVAKMNDSADALRKASEESAAIRDQLILATNDAHAAKAVADVAAGDVAKRENALDQDWKDHAAQVAVDKAAADERAKVLAAQEATVASGNDLLNKRGTELTDLAASLDAREKALADREAAAAALQTDYEARLAKLKALA